MGKLTRYHSFLVISVTENPKDWSDHALWWPAKNTWLLNTKLTMDQVGVHADCLLHFTPMHKTLRIQVRFYFLYSPTLVILKNKSCLAGYLAIISNWNWMGVINWWPLHWLHLSSYCLCKWFVLLLYLNSETTICPRKSVDLWSEGKHRWLSFNWIFRDYNGGLDCIGL